MICIAKVDVCTFHVQLCDCGLTVQDVLAEQPPLVVCMDHTREEELPNTSIRELPPQSTVKDLASIFAYPPGSQILVSCHHLAPLMHSIGFRSYEWLQQSFAVFEITRLPCIQPRPCPEEAALPDPLI